MPSIFEEAMDGVVDIAVEAIDGFAQDYLGVKRDQKELRRMFEDALHATDFEAAAQQFQQQYGVSEWDRQGRLALRRAERGQ